MERIDKPRVGQFSIHDDISIKFMKRLNPDPEVLQIMGVCASPLQLMNKTSPPFMSPITEAAQIISKLPLKKLNPGKKEVSLLRFLRGRSSVHPCQWQKNWITFPGRKNYASALTPQDT